ncbi:MAG TPA: ribonuclease domain-containing protein [Burkholderiaceae bacterium]|nr:ribonuclease domain-containing protein [Burkholderiaceae bacterium]
MWRRLSRWLLPILAAALLIAPAGCAPDAGDAAPSAAARASVQSPAQSAPKPAAQTPAQLPQIAFSELPPQARQTIELIRRGGPFPYERDGTVFFNRERLLPIAPRGHYTEYTVRTPGARDRGARRIVVGGDPRRSDEIYYTDDHYRSFKRVLTPPPSQVQR